MPAKLVVPTEVFSRISGYFRPVQQWNKGKREEFKNRKVVSPGLIPFTGIGVVRLESRGKHLIA